MSGVNKLQKDVHQGNARSGRPGSKKSIVPNSGDNASPTGSEVEARRSADYGGSNESSMQEAIGGVFSGKRGPMTKAERMAKLPS